MSEANTQPVVEDVKTPAQPGAETDNARPDGDLDALLAEYDSATKPDQQQPQPDQQPAAVGDQDIKKLVSEEVSRELQLERKKAEVQQGYDKLLDFIQTETGIGRRVVRGWIEEMAKEKPELASLYFGAKTDAERARVMNSLAREFRKETSITQVDERATADREAVTAAVRSATNRAPEGKAPDYAGMSNAEFREAHKRDYGYYPPV
jgi:hypothetical protein